jgi:hypothetical protein
VIQRIYTVCKWLRSDCLACDCRAHPPHLVGTPKCPRCGCVFYDSLFGYIFGGRFRELLTNKPYPK